MKLDTFPGQHISEVCKEAVALADKRKESVEFVFNDTPVVVQPGETAESVAERWDKDRDAAYQKLINSKEYKDKQAQREKEYREKCAAPLIETARTEQEMRAAKDPWPYTREQLLQYIDSLTERSHDYGTCVYALSLAASAAFNYVAHKLGVTGFQSSCADLDFIRRSRSLDGPFILLKGEDALYPQSDPFDTLREALDEWRPWLKEQAAKKLAEPYGVPAVRDHWKLLAR